jgi:arginyl-tRNA synthetase
MHVGHGRGAVFGDALANLLVFTGYDVTREYYINDGGAQVDVLARSVLSALSRGLGEDIGPIPEGLYPGDYLFRSARRWRRSTARACSSSPMETWLPHRARDRHRHDDGADPRRSRRPQHQATTCSSRSARSPAAMTDDIESRHRRMAARQGLVYEGRLPPPKGDPDEDWEDREQTLFRATHFGDDVDRPLIKSDGSYTYFAADIAYHRNKYLRGFTHMIDVWAPITAATSSA